MFCSFTPLVYNIYVPWIWTFIVCNLLLRSFALMLNLSFTTHSCPQLNHQILNIKNNIVLLILYLLHLLRFYLLMRKAEALPAATFVLLYTVSGLVTQPLSLASPLRHPAFLQRICPSESNGSMVTQWGPIRGGVGKGVATEKGSRVKE